MEAKFFLSELKRMCKHSSCPDCDFMGRNCNYPAICDDTDKAVEAVEKWSREHPILTNADKIKEVFGLDAGSLHSIFDTVYYNSKRVSISEWLRSEYKGGTS